MEKESEENKSATGKEEQKKKVAVMKMDMKIQWMEMKISDMGKMIELKKKAIDDIKHVQEMIKQGK